MTGPHEPGLPDLFAPGAIVLDERAADWEAAVRASGRLLEESGVADAVYTEAMVASVHDNGPYIVLAPGFALAHARPSEAVHRTGMAWVRLASPVEFGHAKNDPVTLVVALAALDGSAHQAAMGSLALLLADPEARAALDSAATPDDVRALLAGGRPAAEPAPAEPAPTGSSSGLGGGTTRDHVLTVCGNGLGTSLFLKNTLEKVLQRWGWAQLLTVEATDTVSARGKAKDADLILTSAEIAATLGDVGVPVRVIENFTSETEIDATLRDAYDVASLER